MLIVFEGADDLGKSTQIEMVYNYLLDKGKKVIITRQPGGTKIGCKIRDILLNSKDDLSKLAELTLFMVDKNIHYDQIIKPFLENKYIILCDRFHLSTLVYQHKLQGMDIEYIDYLFNKLMGGLWPDLTFVFHGSRLTEKIKDEYERKLGNKTHELLNSYYYEYGKIYSNHILINANRDKERVFEEIIHGMEKYL